MAFKLSETVRNKVLDAIETTVGTEPQYIYSTTPWSAWFHSDVQFKSWTDDYLCRVWTTAADGTVVEARGSFPYYLFRAYQFEGPRTLMIALEDKVWDQLLEHAVSEDLLCVRPEPVG
jgi:hypothetical protein